MAHPTHPIPPNTFAQCFFFRKAGLWQDISYLVGTCGHISGLTRVGAGWGKGSLPNCAVDALALCWRWHISLSLSAHVGTYWHPPWSPTTSADIAVSYNDTNGAASSNQGSTKGQCMQDMMFSLQKQLVLQCQNNLYWNAPKKKRMKCMFVCAIMIHLQTWHVFKFRLDMSERHGHVILSSIGRYSWARDLWPSHSANVLTAANAASTLRLNFRCFFGVWRHSKVSLCAQFCLASSSLI